MLQLCLKFAKYSMMLQNFTIENVKCFGFYTYVFNCYIRDGYCCFIIETQKLFPFQKGSLQYILDNYHPGTERMLI